MIKTAESVSPKHPDKICDRISDAILDGCLAQDTNSRVAIETMGGHGIITVTGELTTNAFVDVPAIVKSIAGPIGVQVNIAKQSNDIAKGVDTGGAGDQGIMVGYATAETESMIPKEVFLSRSLNQYIYEALPADGKTQITMDGNQILSVVASWNKMPHGILTDLVKNWMFNNGLHCNNIHCNPAGDWDCGSFDADTGLTGRKLAVDNYGPHIPVGGGAFSGKDASKVDRSGAYMARRVAIDLLRQHKAREVFVWISYAIGRAEPEQCTALVDGKEYNLRGTYDLSPLGIIEQLGLRRPIFEQTAKWGHFGHKEFSWEK